MTGDRTTVILFSSLIPGGLVWDHYAVVLPGGSPGYVTRSSPETALHTARVCGPSTYAAHRIVIQWPDGSMYHTGWQQIKPEGRDQYED